MRKSLSIVTACLSCLLLINSCGPKSGFKREYRMQVTVGPTFYWGIGAIKFADLVKQKTNGKINIKPYFGSQLSKGDQLRTAPMVATGSISCAFDSTINISPIIPEMNIFCLPFFINTFSNLDKLENGQTGKTIFAKMEAKGLKPLAWGENGFRQITNSKRPITKPADLKNLKVRIVGSEIFIDIFRQLGADPIDMNWGDATTAFQQGTVDSQENPIPILIPVQIWQYHKYISTWNYVIDPLILYWNKAEWDSFPPEIQKTIQEAALEAGRFEKALVRAGLDNGKSLKILQDEFKYDLKIKNPVKYLKSKGMTISSLTPDNKKAFIQSVKPVIDKWSKIIGENIIKQAKADMAD